MQKLMNRLLLFDEISQLIFCSVVSVVTTEQENAGRCVAACSVTAENSLINSNVDQK